MFSISVLFFIWLGLFFFCISYLSDIGFMSEEIVYVLSLLGYNISEPGNTDEPGNIAEPGNITEPDKISEPYNISEPDKISEPGDFGEPSNIGEPDNIFIGSDDPTNNTNQNSEEGPFWSTT